MTVPESILEKYCYRTWRQYRISDDYLKLFHDANYYSRYDTKVLAVYCKYYPWLVPYTLSRFFTMIMKKASKVRLPIDQFEDFMQEGLIYVMHHIRYRNADNREISFKDIDAVLSDRVAWQYTNVFGPFFVSPINALILNYVQSVGVFCGESPYSKIDLSRGSDYKTFEIDQKCTKPRNNYRLQSDLKNVFASVVCGEEPPSLRSIPVYDDKNINLIDNRDFIRAILELFPDKLARLYVSSMLLGVLGFRELGFSQKGANIHLNAMHITVHMMYNSDGEIICDRETENEIRAAKNKWPDSMPYCQKVLDIIRKEKAKFSNVFAYRAPKRDYNKEEETIDDAVHRFIQGCYQDVAD